jgi:hypothetical protein
LLIIKIDKIAIKTEYKKIFDFIYTKENQLISEFQNKEIYFLNNEDEFQKVNNLIFTK